MKKLLAVPLLVLAPALVAAQGMPIKSGASSDVATVEANQKALRIVARPLEIGSMGSYAIAGTSGNIAAGMAANAAVFQFRWTSGSGVALIRKVMIGAAAGATGFAAGQASCGLVFARSYSVTGTTGSNSIAITGSEGKRRTSFATSAVVNGDVRISNTAASTGQTWTLDTADLARLGPYTVGTAVQTAFIAPGSVLWAPDYASEWPIVLAQNEGVAVRCTVPATGVWNVTVSVEWSEVATF